MPSDWNFASREKGPTPFGTALFVTLRSLDVYLQYTLLADGLGVRLVSALHGTPISPLALSPNTSFLGLGLTPYHSAIVGLSLGAALKQNAWILGTSEQRMPATFALVIAAFNTTLNTVNTLLSLWAPTTAAPGPGQVPRSLVYLGGAMYAVGLYLEFWSEVQRKRFKQSPEGKGKPYGGGLFGLATNVNYGGYTLWRAGYAMVCAGLPWGLAAGLFVGRDFVTRAIPSMDRYCTEKYGKEWEEIKARVPYRLIPYVY